MKLTFRRDGEQSLVGFSDADWAEDRDDRKSISGYVFTMQGAAISWASKKQQTVVKSTTEAEYVALSNAVQEALWLRTLIGEISDVMKESTIIHADKKGAIELAKEERFSQRTKHIDIAHHIIKERLDNKEILINYVPSEEMLADPLTKAVSGSKLKVFNEIVGVL